MELHLTQPALVELIEDLARELPEDHPLHPLKAGKAPVTLRGLQTWERGGGVAWGKAKLLAQALQTDARVLINGIAGDAPTPSPFAGQDDLASRLDRIEARQDDILDRLDRLQTSLEAAISEQVGGAARSLEASVAEARSILRGANAHPEQPDRTLEQTRSRSA
jgi:hypothetical protein